MKNLSKDIQVKLANDRGETLVEVLVSIVISGLAILLLATAIASGATMNIGSREHVESYYNANNKLVEGAADGNIRNISNGEVQINLKVSETETQALDSIDNVTYTVSNEINGVTIVTYGE